MRKPALSAHRPCPCESGQTYAQCCGALHQAFDAHGQTLADTPEALMRSRYSAYALGLADYLLATWHPATAPGELELSMVKWLGLQVLHTDAQGDAGVVEFVARFKDYQNHGRAQRLHEVSRFVRLETGWRYIDGEMPSETS
jgi:SEC-C motif domain protein